MIRSYLFLIFYLSCFFLSNAQTTTSKWPYYGDKIPSYIGVCGGYEGLKTNNFEVGIVSNIKNIAVTPAVGGMVGGSLFYKKNMSFNNVYSYEVEFGMYSGLVLGLNYNYNVTSVNKIHGFKPFVGLAFYNVQLFYGYSFYNSKDDAKNELRHNRITLRYVLPVIKLSKKQ